MSTTTNTPQPVHKPPKTLPQLLDSSGTSLLPPPLFQGEYNARAPHLLWSHSFTLQKQQVLQLRYVILLVSHLFSIPHLSNLFATHLILPNRRRIPNLLPPLLRPLPLPPHLPPPDPQAPLPQKIQTPHDQQPHNQAPHKVGS